MSNSKPLLVYWDIRALGEPIRMLLRYLEVDFEDRRIPFGEFGPQVLEPWFSQKYSHGLDFPNLPFYIDDEVKITQSIAIIQYIGRKYNLDGDTVAEKATLDMITQTANDLRWAAWVVYNSPDFHEIKEEWKKHLPTKLSEMSNFLKGKKYILGEKLTYADINLYECMQWYREFAKDVFEEAPELKSLNEFQMRIENLPQIKAYKSSTDYKEYPIFAPVVNFGYTKDPDFKPMPFPYRNFVAKYPLDPIN